MDTIYLIFKTTLMNYSELLDIFQSSLCLTNKVFNFLDANYEELNEKNKIRHHILFKMKSTSTTIFKILNQDTENPNFIDFSSAAILTRSILECYKTFYYLTSDTLLAYELEFRLLILELYDTLERQKMIQLLKARELEEIEKQELKEQLDEVKNKIKINQYYQLLELEKEEHQKYKQLFEKDDTCKNLFSEEDKFDKAVMDVAGCFISHYKVLSNRLVKIIPGYEHEEEKIKHRYKFLYKYLSNFVHVSPYSISQHSHLISIDELKKIVLPIIFYLNIANNDILDDFPDLEEELQVKTNNPEIFEGLGEFIEWLRCDIIN
ncbi:DUF5677 domain-containing protein [Aphanizomenon flos-aquae NRERC-008]|jgi:hypothetical protein|uniref:Uncharacterized protein n=2 Tax=Aphanizomenon flos-aquae TaxID=1176 RepID=A0ABR8IU79_APHFL|nr:MULTISPECIES: DUF5677 domain-containing protein [Aphanizomenon]MBD2390640.1 hypothetical protein [Aphanizomenon flos-aquae FACHB-1171]MBD2557615.1 hypothetical protein [Aphanizomenon flos-aquae FACHB-1290]MBD2642837.1 hypothetical protein [Aphanizomenon sp. FACHB-1401]MBD2657428.1 hypothetical protein [Aphanizomenon flos-aquae FACHB-1265]MBD2686089.1 hypothetical protein [Aphanizomenon flos-aquae FACHB-1249]